MIHSTSLVLVSLELLRYLPIIDFFATKSTMF